MPWTDEHWEKLVEAFLAHSIAGIATQPMFKDMVDRRPDQRRRLAAIFMRGHDPDQCTCSDCLNGG